MEQKINIAEILKYCPKGMEIDCTMWDNVVFEKLDVRSSHHPIIIRRTGSNDSYYTTAHLTKYGQYSDEKDCKCVIYPKGKTTWEGFVPPCQFKEGDRVMKKGGISVPVLITGVGNVNYCYNTENSDGFFKIKEQDDWELVPNKFDITTLKSFDKVLVRRNENNKWRCSFFSHMDEDLHYHCYKHVTITGKSYPMCIPYEGNEHLLNTPDDCEEYFKTW